MPVPVSCERRRGLASLAFCVTSVRRAAAYELILRVKKGCAEGDYSDLSLPTDTSAELYEESKSTL